MAMKPRAMTKKKPAMARGGKATKMMRGGGAAMDKTKMARGGKATAKPATKMMRGGMTKKKK